MPTAEPQPWDNRRTLAVVLLGLGVFALAQRYLGSSWNQLVLLGIGVAMIVASLASRMWGLLVAGCVIVGIGSGMIVRKTFEFSRDESAGAFLICFGAGWFLLTILSAIGFKRRALWAMIPGGMLVVFGLAQFLRLDYEFYLKIFRDFWPVAAIAAGIYILVFPPKRSKDGGD